LYELNFRVHNVSATLSAICLRSHPEVLSEGGAEVALIKEAGSECDLGQSGPSVLHECQSVTQATPHPILSRRAAESLSKRPGEVDGMHSELLRHLGDLQRVTASIVEEFSRSTNP
jgi:hypothetical protein